MLEFVEVEHIARRETRRAGLRFGRSTDYKIGEIELMQADQKRDVRADPGGVLDAGGPDLRGKRRGRFKHMQGQSGGIQRGAIIVKRPSGIVGGDRGDHFRSRSRKKIVAEMSGKKACEGGVIDLRDELKVRA